MDQLIAFAYGALAYTALIASLLYSLGFIGQESKTLRAAPSRGRRRERALGRRPGGI